MDDRLKSVASVIGLMVAIFGLLKIFLPTSLIPPVGALVIGLALTGYMVSIDKWTWGTAFPTWLAVSIGLIVVNLIVSRPATFVGSIMESNGVPVAGLRLVLTDSSGVDHTVITDEKGAFEIKNIPQGRLTISVDGESLIRGQVPSGWVRIINNKVEMQDIIYNPSPVPTKTPTPTSTATSTLTPTSMPTSTNTSTPTSTPTPKPTLTPTPECRFNNLLNCSDPGAIYVSEESQLSLFPITPEGLVVDFSNDKNGSGVFFNFSPALDVRGFSHLELSGISTQAFSFLVEYKALLAGNQSEIVTTSSHQSFPASQPKTIKIPVQYDGTINQIVINFHTIGDSSVLTIDSIRLK